MEKSSKSTSQNNGKARGEKPPSRLQKQAPSVLQLDPNVSAGVNTFTSSGDIYSGCAIPLLSPLIFPPPPSPETEDKGAEGDERPEQGKDDKKGGSAPSGEWKHPAAPTLTEPSSLRLFFQSKCVLVPHAQ